MDILDLIVSADPNSLIPFAKSAVFAWLVAYMTIGVVEALKALFKSDGAEFPAWLPTPIISALVGMVLMDGGLLLLGGSPLLLGRYTILGLASGFMATGHYAITTNSDQQAVAVAVGRPTTDPAVVAGTGGKSDRNISSQVIQVIHSIGDDPLPPPAPPLPT